MPHSTYPESHYDHPPMTYGPPAAMRSSALRIVCSAFLLLGSLLSAAHAQGQRPPGWGQGPSQGPGQGAPGGGGGRPSGPLEVDITQGTLKPIPIAIPEFLGDDPRFAAEVRLWDVFSGRQLAGQRFAVGADDWRRLGHLVADLVYERLSGEKGYFDTQVVFIDETGPKDKRNKRLAIMDQDGANIRLLSQGRELVLTPRFSPTQHEITYMQYTGDQPRVFRLNIETGQRQLVGDFPNMTFAPRFSPDGQRVVMSIGEGSASSIVELDLRSKQTRRLTQSNAIDTGPCFSPDGKRIVFESDRDGTQQLFVMNTDGSGQRRISNGDGRYSTPVWSPRGDLIAFTKQSGGQFLIGVMRPDGSGERILTEGYHNEGPTWAPNGRVIMFFRESQGAGGGPKLFSIDLTGYNERQVQTPAFASDPAWSPLRN